jgi:hypothetical protein
MLSLIKFISLALSLSTFYCLSQASSNTLVEWDSFEKLSEKIAREGETALNSLEKRSCGNICFENSFRNLRDSGGCYDMSAEQRRLLAIDLTICHMKESGVDISPCPRGFSVIECAASLASTPIAFQAYTEFYIQAENMCYFLEKEVTEKKMHQTIQQLYSSANSISSHLHEMSDLLSRNIAEMIDQISSQQSSILEGQTQLSVLQDTMKLGQSEMLSSIIKSKEIMSHVLVEQQLAHGKTLSALSQLEDSLVPYFAIQDRIHDALVNLEGSSSIIKVGPGVYYTFLSLFWIFATILKSTNAIRPSILLLVLLNIICERIVLSLIPVDFGMLTSVLFAVRLFFLLSEVGYFLFRLLTYRDIEEENRNLIQSFLQSAKLDNVPLNAPSLQTSNEMISYRSPSSSTLCRRPIKKEKIDVIVID